MIARLWRGATRSKDAARYLDYLRRTGLAAYRETPGNRGVLTLTRMFDDRTEFLLVSLWESSAAVRRFAGDDPTRAVFYPEDERYLVERDEHVTHFDVADGDVDDALATILRATSTAPAGASTGVPGGRESAA